MNVRGLIEPEVVVELIFQGKMDYLQFREIFFNRWEYNYKILRGQFVSEALGIKSQGIYDFRYDPHGVYIYDLQGNSGKELYLKSMKEIINNRGVPDEDFYRNANFKVVAFSGYEDGTAEIEVEGHDETITICSKDYIVIPSYTTPSPINRVFGINEEPEIEFIVSRVTQDASGLLEVPNRADYKPDPSVNLTTPQLQIAMSLAQPAPEVQLLGFEFDNGLQILEKHVINSIKSKKFDYAGFEMAVMKNGRDSLDRECDRLVKIIDMHNLTNPNEQMTYQPAIDYKFKIERGLKNYEENIKKSI